MIINAKSEGFARCHKYGKPKTIYNAHELRQSRRGEPLQQGVQFTPLKPINMPVYNSISIFCYLPKNKWIQRDQKGEIARAAGISSANELECL